MSGARPSLDAAEDPPTTYEFYIQLVKQGTNYTFYFSRDGYYWTAMASNAVTGYSTSYIGFCVSVPSGGVRSSVILEGFEVVPS